ncbi:MAG: alpha-glucosidase [Candidatus Hermodarchaeota archaeon]
MLKFEQIKEGFKLYFKEFLFLVHTPSNPSFYIGQGTGRFKMHHGHFKIREKLLKKSALENYELTHQSNDILELKLYGQKQELNVKIEIDNYNLKINFYCPNSKMNRFWIRILATKEEAIYGCGEQFSEVNLRGKDVPLWVEEQGVGRGDPPITGDWYTTYHPQPTFVSSENYFCHCESSSYAKFNFTNPDFHELYIWSIPERILFGKFETAVEVISNLSSYLGRQPKLPEWVYDGVWLGVQGGKEIVEEKINKCLENEVKLIAVWCQDWQGIHMQGEQKRLIWNWEYDENIYPDLPAYIKYLNSRGIRFLGYINSMLAKDEEQYIDAIKKDLCIKKKDGKLYKIITDSGEKSLLDLSNPLTIQWLKQIIKENMINIGLSGWMADYGEYLPVDSIIYSGENSEFFHNKYPVIFAKANLEAIEESGKLGDIVFFTRSGYSKISRYTTLVWAGDQLVNWSIHDGLATVIPAGISLGFCGIGYYHFDIGGFHSLGDYIRDKEVFMRWTELSAFTMIMRTHESIRPYQNWQFDSDDDTLNHFSRMSQIYVHLKPYIQQLSKEYIETGIPPIRACYLHYENDPELHKIKYQYLFGRDLLVAPVIKPNIINWNVYLPDDTWFHIWTGKRYTGGWITVMAPIGQPPVFYRECSVYSKIFDGLKAI